MLDGQAVAFTQRLGSQAFMGLQHTDKKGCPWANLSLQSLKVKNSSSNFRILTPIVGHYGVTQSPNTQRDLNEADQSKSSEMTCLWSRVNSLLHFSAKSHLKAVLSQHGKSNLENSWTHHLLIHLQKCSSEGPSFLLTYKRPCMQLILTLIFGTTWSPIARLFLGALRSAEMT